MRLLVEKSALTGQIAPPPSKSHTMRAILLAALAAGQSRIRNSLPSPDSLAMLAACRAFGAQIEEDGPNLRDLLITGLAARPRCPDKIIEVGNSGQVLRFWAAFSALAPGHSVFSGDESVRGLRPMQPLLDGLSGLGAQAVSSRGNGLAPVIIHGPARAGRTALDGEDSQPVSALLMLAAHLPGQSTIEVRNPGEKPWVDLTLFWLNKLGANCTNHDYRLYVVEGQAAYPAFAHTVPADWSSAAFPIAAALVTGSELRVGGLDFADPQGDKRILDLLLDMGAKLIQDPDHGLLTVPSGQKLRGAELDVNAVIDAVPVLTAVACFAEGPTLIKGAAIARHKESDRLAAMARELRKMGAEIEERPDGLLIRPVPLHGAQVDSHRDHRIAMSLAIAGLACGKTRIENTACVAKSYPDFAGALTALGAKISEQKT